MRFVCKYFNELTTEELYEMLRVRSHVFVVEHKCIYQDIDGLDQESLHIFYEEDGKILAYLRVFPKAGEEGTLQMGRVLTAVRRKGLGGRLLRKAMDVIRDELKAEKIYAEAQCYAVGYYEREGFRVCTEEFDEDGIPHVGMEVYVKRA